MPGDPRSGQSPQLWPARGSAKTRAQIAKKGAPHETAPNSGTATGRILGSSPRRGGAPAGSRRPLGPPARRAQLGEFALCAQAGASTLRRSPLAPAGCRQSPRAGAAGAGARLFRGGAMVPEGQSMAAWRRRQAVRTRALRPVSPVRDGGGGDAGAGADEPGGGQRAEPGHAGPGPAGGRGRAARGDAARRRQRGLRRRRRPRSSRSVRRGTTRCGAAAPAACGARCCCPSTSTSERTSRPPQRGPASTRSPGNAIAGAIDVPAKANTGGTLPSLGAACSASWTTSSGAGTRAAAS